MRRARCGFSLVELMAAVALMGLLVAGAAGLVASSQQEAEAVAQAQDGFDERWLAAAQLRADVERAGSARLEDGWLLLDSDPPVAWRVGSDELTRHGSFTRRYRVSDVAPLRVERRGRSELVRWSWGEAATAAEGLAIVGGAS